jgi:hypothetical protein
MNLMNWNLNLRQMSRNLHWTLTRHLKNLQNFLSYLSFLMTLMAEECLLSFRCFLNHPNWYPKVCYRLRSCLDVSK